MPDAAMWREGAATEGRPEDLLPARAPGRRGAPAHVCFVAPHAWPALAADPRVEVIGGAEVQQSLLARLLARAGFRVSMVCCDYGQPERTVVDGVTVYKAFAPEAGVPVLRFLHPRLTAMWRALGEADADIYYCRSVSMWLAVVAHFCRRRGRRSIYAGASDKDFLPAQGGQIRYARDRWLFRRGLAAADRIVVQNETQRAQCRARYGREALVIPSCYEPPRDAAPGRGDRVLWVGRMHESKRPEMFLELARLLPQRRFVMIGGAADGADAYHERIRRAAEVLPNLEFTGFLPLAEVERWFDRARVLVLTSEFEGMPNVFLQAWARGVPTVATVDPGAAVNRVFREVQEAAREVERLFDDAQHFRALSRRCREHFARHHSSAGVLERYAALFKELAP